MEHLRVISRILICKYAPSGMIHTFCENQVQNFRLLVVLIGYSRIFSTDKQTDR
jgi:hypothetical protein